MRRRRPSRRSRPAGWACRRRSQRRCGSSPATTRPTSRGRSSPWTAACRWEPEPAEGEGHWSPSAAEPAGGGRESSEMAQSREEVVETMKEGLSSELGVDAEKVTADARFKEDLDADSLDLVEVVLALEEKFSIEIPDEEI